VVPVTTCSSSPPSDIRWRAGSRPPSRWSFDRPPHRDVQTMTIPMRSVSMRFVSAVAGALLVVSCQSLDVTNPNAPTLDATLNNPTNVELTVASSFKYLWAHLQNDDPRQGVTLFPGVPLSGLADEVVYGTNNSQ